MTKVVGLAKGREGMVSRLLFWGSWQKGRLVLSMADLAVVVAERPW